MKSKLKICLAMGGGVSLGAFSGSALTEALKLLLLYGQNKKGQRYDSIELDGFSGASAGSISLTILVCVLLDYNVYLELDVVKNHYAESDVYSIEKKIKQDIKSKYTLLEGEEWEPNLLDTMVALEIAQLMQYIIWVEQLDIKNILDEKKKQDPLYPFGLMSKDFLLKLSNEFISNRKFHIDADNRKMLADRVLMAFSMANLSPIAYGDKIGKSTENSNAEQSSSDVNLINSLKKATSIENHNELRVFEFILNDQELKKGFDPRFISIFDKKLETKVQKTLKNNSRFILQDTWSWSHIAASAMASGAFPLAFEPVVLKRWKSEFAHDEWPLDDQDHIDFTYIDGGAFNNEPIKEAFKLGAYKDYLDKSYDFNSIDLSTDRLIIFVDPAVPAETQIKQLASLDPLKHLDKKFINYTKNESNKIASGILDIGNMIINQSKINEEAKVAEFYRSALLKNSIGRFLTKVHDYDFEELLESNIVSTYSEMAQKSLRDRQISIGTRSLPSLLFNQYRQLCDTKYKVCLTPNSFDELLTILKDDDSNMEQINTFFKKAECDPENIQIVAQSIFLTISEFALNFTGKSEYAERIGIFPVDENSEIENLPGSEMFAFAGFINKNAREACYYKGIIDTARCLSKSDFRRYHYINSLKLKMDNIAPNIRLPNTVIETNDSAVQINSDALRNYVEDNVNTFITFKNNYENQISKDAQIGFRNNLIVRLTPLIKEIYKGENKFKLAFGPLLGLFFPKKVIGRLLNKQLFIDAVSKINLVSLRLITSDDLSSASIRVKLNSGKILKIKTVKLVKRYFKIYFYPKTNKFYLNSKLNRLGKNFHIDELMFIGEDYHIEDIFQDIENFDSVINSINPLISLYINEQGKIQAKKAFEPVDMASLIYDYQL